MIKTNQSEEILGFKFAAEASGIRKSGRLDLALIYSEVPARCAGVFTTNKIKAAPLLLTEPRIAAGLCQAILVNSGNANACTGAQGLRDAKRCSELAAAVLQIPEEYLAVSSTGVIGAPLPMDPFETSIPLLAKNLVFDGVEGVSQAIMTTDSFSKLASCQGEVVKTPYRLLGVAKGAGMIHPNMATMLGFVLTDAQVEPILLQEALRRAVENSFNIITVDGDTSTNDMVLLLANGAAGNREICSGTAEGERFVEELTGVLLELAKMIVRDGEGATKLVRIRITGAASDGDAKKAANSVATSSLVKTAFFGEDANWGRIIAAVGYSGAAVDPERVEICFDDVPVVRQGISTGKELEAQATTILKQAEFTVTVDLGLGSASADYYTSDLTYEYVKINADYRT
ncbi:MAG: bifunctional glutamate N-acetyltransferase/amino-acid acetyltransferase ArgJ [Desulfuromonadaceae bacterium]|nr:bifunctional glutamate N-acetyltransferase/amino-acid acetyltransferase ArgJ [Desulfuromonadaceae bacterium]